MKYEKTAHLKFVEALEMKTTYAELTKHMTYMPPDILGLTVKSAKWWIGEKYRKSNANGDHRTPDICKICTQYLDKCDEIKKEYLK